VLALQEVESVDTLKHSGPAPLAGVRPTPTSPASTATTRASSTSPSSASCR
jgi:hypothetical protein